MARVMWQPPNHQQVIGGEHPTGHGCADCTIKHQPVVIGRRLTRRGARRRAEYLNAWSARPGHFYAEGEPWQ